MNDLHTRLCAAILIDFDVALLIENFQSFIMYLI